MLEELIDEIQDLILDYFRKELKTYKFKSADAEEGIWTMIRSLNNNVGDLINDSTYQIECELDENISYSHGDNIIEFSKYR